MERNDEPVHPLDCPGCELCKTFELAARLLELIRNRGSDWTVEMNALIVAAGYNTGREGDHLDTALDTFRYAYVLGRRERENPTEGGLSRGSERASWCPAPASAAKTSN